MSDEQVVAILAAIFLAADNIRGGLRAVEASVDAGRYGDKEWRYDSRDDAIASARELLAAAKNPPAVGVGASRPTGDPA